MGRNKFSQHEINCIARLLRKKNAGTRYQQKLIRHHLRVDFEFNISDFNVQGKAFGEEELHEAIRRGAIHILDDATIEAMKAKRAAQKAADASLPEPASTETSDWQTALKEWEEYYGPTAPENEPATRQPATDRPVSSPKNEPATQQPATDRPVSSLENEPATQQPATDRPVSSPD